MICKHATLLKVPCTNGYSKAIECSKGHANCIAACGARCPGWTPVEIPLYKKWFDPEYLNYIRQDGTNGCCGGAGTNGSWEGARNISYE